MANFKREISSRVLVSVSESMARLRQTQSVLNGFWQTSELAYGYMLSNSETLLKDPTRPTVELLGFIESAIWFPNNQGRIKLTENIDTTLKRVRDNTVFAYRASLLSFFCAFEDYLETEAEKFKPAKVKNWGEYVRSLSAPEFLNAPFPLPLRAIMCADFSREIRNCMVHENFSVPRSVQDPRIADWRTRLARRADEAGWPKSEIKEAINFATHQVIGQAAMQVEKAQKEGKTLPVELFYMLFTFTNLDSLAFYIEEALLPENARTGSQVARKKTAIRRNDLILSQVQ